MPRVKCPIVNCTYETDDLPSDIVIKLLDLHAISHTGSSPPAPKVDRVRRPTVSPAGTGEEWQYFLTRWGEYKTATQISGSAIVIQLLECCDEQLRKDLTRAAGGSLTAKSEEDVLASIKRLAVREENPMVARVALHDMRQDNDEPIRAFGARIRGQAGVCKYNVTCPDCSTTVDFTDCILRDVLARGIADPEIQLDLLGDAKQDMSLEEIMKFVESKESGRRSASRLHESKSSQAAASSSYNRLRRQAHKERQTSPQSDPPPCSYCGRAGHGTKAPPHVRKTECPAYNKSCNHCNRQHHFGHMCRSKGKLQQPVPGGQHKRPSTQPNATATINNENAVFDQQMEGAVFDALCILNSTPNNANSKPSVTLDHHLYDQLTDTWTRQSSKPQPFINITASISPSDYSALGFPTTVTPKSTTLSVMADTGCQSCLAGIKAINRLGVTSKDLIPVTMRMHAANNAGINILGAVILRLSGESPSGQRLETRQLVYVTDSSDRVFLSREACTDLGMLPRQFPTIGEVPEMKDSSSSVTHSTQQHQQESPGTPLSNDTGLTAPCNCPKRQLPPPKPDHIPFAPTEENREKLQEWLLNYYRSSTFNMCEHQPLPMMEGPPMHLMIDPEATPVAHHKPLPVPLHWRDDIKAGLDQDVRLGVIEPVPIGEPVTWCHCMVVCPKKNGKPRRTVDFQALNLHATRETHHTQSPISSGPLRPTRYQEDHI